MPAPCTPGTSFYADKRKQNPPGRPRSPYLCATMGALGKSSLVAPRSKAEDFSANADALAGLQEAHSSKEPHLGRGEFLRGAGLQLCRV